jgi:hypothetical protein
MKILKSKVENGKRRKESEEKKGVCSNLYLLLGVA